MYNGFLIKIGEYVFPMKHIAEQTYRVKPHQRQDLSSERNANGRLLREVVNNRPSVIEFATVAGLTNTEVREIFRQIHDNYTNEAERMVLVTFYDPEMDEYAEVEEMYLPNPEFPIDYVEGTTVVYNSISFEFIGY